jgi:hypothetical protein
MINLTLKAKHYYYVTNFLTRSPANQAYSLISRIKTLTKDGTSSEDDDITMSASVEEVGRIYNILTNQPEGKASAINKEMVDILMPQVITGMQAGNVEWISIGQDIETTKEANIRARDLLIHSGKTFLSEL